MRTPDAQSLPNDPTDLLVAALEQDTEASARKLAILERILPESIGQNHPAMEPLDRMSRIAHAKLSESKQAELNEFMHREIDALLDPKNDGAISTPGRLTTRAPLRLAPAETRDADPARAPQTPAPDAINGTRVPAELKIQLQSVLADLRQTLSGRYESSTELHLALMQSLTRQAKKLTQKDGVPVGIREWVFDFLQHFTERDVLTPDEYEIDRYRAQIQTRLEALSLLITQAKSMEELMHAGIFARYQKPRLSWLDRFRLGIWTLGAGVASFITLGPVISLLLLGAKGTANVLPAHVALLLVGILTYMFVSRNVRGEFPRAMRAFAYLTTLTLSAATAGLAYAGLHWTALLTVGLGAILQIYLGLPRAEILSGSSKARPAPPPSERGSIPPARGGRRGIPTLGA